MQLKKINQDHYVVVNEDADINENDFTLKNGEIIEVSFLMQDNGNKIIASTQPLEEYTYKESGEGIFGKDFFNIKPLDLSYIKSLVGEVDVEKKAIERLPKSPFGVSVENEREWIGFKLGYNQCLEDNKHLIKRPTEWNVKFDEDGKIILI